MPVSTATGYWIERELRAMGSTVQLIVGDADAMLVDWAVAELERLEQCWSRFRADSELSALNASAGEWVAVSPTLLMALTRARELWHATAGAFDPTVLDALERSGYDRSFELVDPSDPRAVPSPRRVAGFEHVELDVDGSAVRLVPGARLDLGGLGKGLAADVIAEGIVDRGARTSIVSLGGDIRAGGEPPDGGWTIPVEDPFDAQGTAFEHRLVGGAIVTCTRMIRTWSRSGREYHHIVDPCTGASADRGIAAVVAVAGETWWAEGVAKSVMILGPERGAALLQDTGVSASVFLDNRSVVELGSERACSPT